MHRWSEEDVAEFCLHDAWETGQEDLPSAYRYCPMSQQESLGCVVVWFHHEWQTPAYQVYGLLFGWASAGSHFLQQIFQIVGSADSAVLPSFDIPVL